MMLSCIVIKLKANGAAVRCQITTIALVIVKPDTKHFDKVNARVADVALFNLSLLVVY